MLARVFRPVSVDEELDDVVGGVEDVLLPFALVEDGTAQRVDRLTLLVHHVVVFEEVLARFEVAPFDLLLGALDGAGDHAVLDRHALFHAEALHQARDAIGAEDAHQVVFEREIEARGAGIALASRTAAELIVDPARFVTLGADDVQTAEADHLVVIDLPLRLDLVLDALPLGRVGDFARLLSSEELRIAAEENVRAAAGHVRGDRDGALVAGLRNDLRFALVILRVQDDVRHALALEHRAEELRLLDRDRTDQRRLTFLASLLDVLDDRFELLPLGAEHEVRHVLPDHRPVRRHDDDFEVVDLLELRGFGIRGAGHAGELVVHPEEVLERDRGERLVLRLDLHPLLRLDGLVETVASAASRHEAAGELVDDDDLPVLDEVLDVAPVQRVSAQALLDAVQRVHVGGVVEIVDAEELLGVGDALFGHDGGVLLLVDLKVGLRDEARDDAIDRVVLVDRLLRGTADDERRTSLVDEDRVDLVDDRVDRIALHHRLEVELHVVAEVVEAELVVRAVGDVAAIRFLPLAVAVRVLDDADGQAEEFVEAAHPLGVAAGQVIVDGDHVHAAAG